jgi:hypothetical protein
MVKKDPKDEQGYVIEREQPFLKLTLSIRGFEEYQKSISRDAAEVFSKAGVIVSDIPKLRDLNGRNIFDSQGILNDRGKAVYADAVKGKKNFLLPDEPVPYSKTQLEAIRKRMEEIHKSGYMYITHKELDYLQERSLCSYETLVKNLKMFVWKVRGRDIRHFVIVPPQNDSFKKPEYYPYLYIAEYRHSLADKPAEAVKFSSFFGTGGSYGSSTLCDRNGDLSYYYQRMR